MKRTTKRSLIYTVHTSTGHDYSHFYLTVYEPKEWSQTDYSQLLELSWQANRDARADFYGSTVNTAFHGASLDIAERLARAAKLLAKLTTISTPAQALDYLQKIPVPRAVYDSRFSRYVTERELIDPTHARFMDDYARYGMSNCSVSAVCADEDTAKGQLTREFCEYIAKWPNDTAHGERFAAWVNAGKPIMRDRFTTAPTFQPLTELLNQPAQDNAAAA